jgi:transaldolase/glucose-6-phosphate isomerase
MKTINDNNVQQLSKKISIQFSGADVSNAINAELEVWEKENNLQRLWDSDASLWTNADEAKWTGWLNVTADRSDIPRIEALAHEFRNAGITDLAVLGMGGSSLCPAMFATTFEKVSGAPYLHILDSTDPMQIHSFEKKLHLEKTIFIISSKSGTTLEPNIFKDYFYALLQKALNKTNVGDHFIAITDPGTPLEQLAKDENFKAGFFGVPSIGGRYSALSNFGMVPLGLMGINVTEFLDNVGKMHTECLPSSPIKNNSGLILGVVLGVCCQHGKDKVTLIVSPGISAIGAWIEQLLAESTGKKGKGLIPVNQEALGKPDVYGDDRVFVYIRAADEIDKEQERAVVALEQAGFVVVRLQIADKMHLGAEMFRWEIATAVAGSIIGINPFNQPDVEESKVLAIKLTTKYEETQHLVEPKAFFSDEGIELFTDESNKKVLTADLVGEPSIAGYLRAHLDRIQKDDYVDLSAFLEMSDENNQLLQKSRLLIRDNKKIATCLGFGPRFLHSTGQDYKGGPNTGVFLQLTTQYKKDIEVPTHDYTFGLVITAQAEADFTVLSKRSRRALRIHFQDGVHQGLRKLYELLEKALED